MNTEPKILSTVYTEGGTLLRGEPEVRKYALTKKELFPNQKFKNKEGDKVIKRGKYTFIPTIPSTATRKITMCKEAYDYFISPTCPEWFKNVKEWKKLSEEQRLIAHLKRTCDHFGGKSFTYQIIDD